MEPVLKPPICPEGDRERATQLPQLPDGQRATFQGAEDLAVAVGQKRHGQNIVRKRDRSYHPALFIAPFPAHMSTEKPRFVNVDELMPQISVEQAAQFYGVALPELKAVGKEIRAACFLACGKSEPTGDRALAIQSTDPAKKWHCHQYGCGKGSNLVGLCDLMKPGANAGGRPRGERFKEIAQDLHSMANGNTNSNRNASTAPAPQSRTVAVPKVNIPLKDSDNERARGLTELDGKFIVDVANMNPKASAYFRRRPFLTPEVCCSWRMGYLPRDAGGDKAGGTMRGKITYAYLSEAGEVLCFFGRDPEFEDKHDKWDKGDKSEPEPEKFHFVKGFHRGIELFGQHQLRAEGAAEKLQGLGLVLVEGPNDVIKMSELGVPAVGLCSNMISREQAEKAARIAREVAGGIVSVFLDCDAEGQNGMRQCLGYLAQQVPVRLAWSEKMYGGKFRGRQPESLAADEWTEIREYLVTGKADGWSLS